MRTPIRRFTILDTMILVAAVAAGLGLARAFQARWGPSVHGVSQPFREPIALFVLLPTLAIIPLRLRRPRPSLRRVMRQPGMVAACAAAVAVGLNLVSWAIYSYRYGSSPWDYSYVARFWRLAHGQVPPTVACCWLALWLSGRWRPERSWIDRLGRVLGGFWMALLLLTWDLGRWVYSVIDRIAMGLRG